MKKTFPVVLFILMILASCNSDTIDISLYEGKNLVIGVIGDAPKVREDNINFTKITFNELEDETLLADFDAVFIMKEHLTEAADSKYAKVYRNSGIPFFFIESKKPYINFVEEELSYEDFQDSKSGDYAIGYFQSGEEGQFWGYGLYNDKVNEPNIKDAYIRIFTTIESIENEK